MNTIASVQAITFKIQAYTRSIVILFLFSISPYSLFCQDPILIDEKFHSLILNEQVGVLHIIDESSASKNIINRDKAEFRVREDLTFPRKKGVYWLRFELINEHGSAIDHILELGSIGPHYTRLFINNNSSLDSSKILGDYMPFSERYFDYRKMCFPFTIKSSDTLQCFLYVNKSNETLNMPLRLWKAEDFINSSFRSEVWIGSILFACLLMGLLTFYYAIVYKNRLTISLFFLTISLILVFLNQSGLLSRYLPAHLPTLSHDFRIVRFHLIHIFGLIFMIELLSIKKNIPVLYRPLWVLIILFGIGTILSLLQPVFAYSVKSLYALYLITIIISTIAQIFAPLYSFIKYKNTISFLFLLNSTISLYLIFIYIQAFILDNKVDSFWVNDVLLYFPFCSAIIYLGALLYFQYVRYTLNKKLTNQLSTVQTLALHNLLEGQKVERKRLSQQLHDGVGATLSAIRMRLSSIDNTTKLDSVIDDLGVVSQDIRNFSHDLSPLILDKIGFIRTLEDLVEKIIRRSENIDIDLVGLNSLPVLFPKSIEENLYFIILELLNNTLKHARASKIKIEMLVGAKDELQLNYFDDGIGLLDEHQMGHGMNNIEARIKLLQGKIDWNKNCPKGVAITIRIPFSAKNQP